MRIILISEKSRQLPYTLRMSKPLWIPLKREYFEAFERGEKSIEYRRYGGRWAEQHVYPGRPAILGLGYSGRRLRAIVTGFETRVMDSQTYGPQVLLALIHLRVLDPVEPSGPRTVEPDALTLTDSPTQLGRAENAAELLITANRKEFTMTARIYTLPTAARPTTSAPTDIGPEPPMPELIPCPFCGDPNIMDGAKIIRMPEYDGYAMEVECCGAVGPPAETRGEAAAAWNRRQTVAEWQRTLEEDTQRIREEDTVKS
jgi:Lar family restriction alleviation protein